MTYEELENLNIDFSDCKINSAAPGPSGKQKKSLDQEKNLPIQEQKPKSKAGRKNRGLTKKHYEEKKAFYRELRNINAPKTFNSEIIETIPGEIVNDDDITQFKELYMLTCQSVLEQFKNENPDLKPQQNYIWYKRLFTKLKENCPAVSYKDLEKLYVVWDCFAWLLNEIGLYITFQTFSLYANVYDYQLEAEAELNPKYRDFLQKIYTERRDSLVNELNYNPYTQGNKIFMAKVLGIIEKTEPKQIEVHHDIRNYNNLPMFGDLKQ